LTSPVLNSALAGSIRQRRGSYRRRGDDHTIFPFSLPSFSSSISEFKLGKVLGGGGGSTQSPGLASVFSSQLWDVLGGGVKRRTVEEAGLRVVAGGRNRSNRRVGAPFYTHRRRGRYWGSAGVRFFGLSPYFLSRGSSRGTAGVALSLCLS
jgi:hypothetical protein